MPDDHDALTDRLRAVLAPEPSVREVAMFGGLAFMVDGRMAVHLRRGGALLVRIDPNRSAELVNEHGARPAEMGTGRSMGPGWLDVPDDLLGTDDALRWWVGLALEFGQTLK